jgi:glycogen(starch) synthase
MRILLVSAEYPPESPGGLGNATRNLALGLKACGAHPFVLSSSRRPSGSHEETYSEEMDDGVPVFRINYAPKRLKREPSWFWRFHDFYLPADCHRYSRLVGEACFTLIRRLEIDVVQFPDYKGEAYHFTRRANFPTVIRLATPLYMVKKINRSATPAPDDRPGTFEGTAERLMRHIECEAIKRASALASPSASLARLVAEDIGAVPETEIIPTGIDIDMFKPARATDVAAFRRSLGLGEGPVIVFAGRYEYRKGIHDLVDAMKLIRERIPVSRLVLAGGDTETAPGGGSMKKHLEEKTRSLGLQSQVVFLDRVPHDQLILLYSLATVFAAPSLYENLANTILEAMACGAPVVSTTSGGAPEVIDIPQNGMLVAPGDTEALAGAILELLSDPDRCKMIGENNRRKAQERFSRRRMAADFLVLYERVLSRTR